MKIKVGIVGYGNLGKALEEMLLKDKRFKLVAIFSRRVVVSKFNTPIEPYDEFLTYKKKINIMFLCGSSASDIQIQAPEISKYFNIINSFDIHSRLTKLTKELDLINKQYKTVSLSAVGWDPGLLSIIRCLCFGISDEIPSTFWGKGVSMGHSDAVRKIDGVIDAVQFTVPNKDAMIFSKKMKSCENIAKHNRECYVVSNLGEENRKIIAEKIKNIPNYFKGQPTHVEFVSQIELIRLEKNMSHKGTVINPFYLSKNKKAYLEFVAKMDSNPHFTAKIMLRFAFGVMNFVLSQNFGAFLPIDIPISSLFSEKELIFIKNNLC